MYIYIYTYVNMQIYVHAYIYIYMVDVIRHKYRPSPKIPRTCCAYILATSTSYTSKRANATPVGRQHP